MDSNDDKIDENMQLLQELIEKLQISIIKNPECEADVNLQLKKLLYDIQNKNISSDNTQYDINDSPAYKLITDRFGKISNNALTNIAIQLSSQSQIPISRDIYRKPILLVKWIDCHFQQFANLIESMELTPNQ